MRHAREIIRLKFSCVSTDEIARRLGMARSTVRETLNRADGAGLSWPLPEGMNDEALEAALYANRRSKRGHRRISEPNWACVHRELKRKHVTLLILWDEYIAANPGGYSYSRFCELYRAFEKTVSVTMRAIIPWFGGGSRGILDRGNHGRFHRLTGGAERIRNSDLRGAGTRSPDGGTASDFARLNSEGSRARGLASANAMFPTSPAIGPSYASASRPRRLPAP